MVSKSILTIIAGICAGFMTGCHNTESVALGAMKTPTALTRAATNLGRRDRLSVLTFNMQHRNNPDQLTVMADRLEADLLETPDFILCQEVLFQRSQNPDEANTAALLANDLGCYWRGTKRSSDREGVAIISRYPFEYYAERELKSQTSRLLLGFNRVSVMGEFIVPEVGRVRVVNVHFTNWGFERRVRENQLRETLDWMADRERHVPADLLILGGDFNIADHGASLSLVTEGPIAFQNFNTNAPTRGTQGRPNKRIDYIFVSSPYDQINVAGAGERRLWLDGLVANNRRFWLSDHVPVLHEYAISESMSVAAVDRLSEYQAQ